MMNPYLGKTCPNRCLDKLAEQARRENIVDGHDPKLLWDDNIGDSTIRVYRWSKRLKRHTETPNGHYLSQRFKYCPHCGAKLIEER